MTEQTNTPDEVEEPKPLLDLDVLVDRRDFIQVAGTKYYLRTDGLGAIPHHRLIHCSNRHDVLFEKDKLTAREAKEMDELVTEMLDLILDAPEDIRKQIKGSHARALLRHFQRASQPEAELLDQLLSQMALAGMGTRAEGSTTES